MRRSAGALLLALTLAGCDLDYGKAQETPADQVPQMVFEGLKQTGIKDGRLLYTMETARSEVFPAKKQMRLNRFQFQEYDSQGLPASSGAADGAVIDTASNDATISGRLTVRSDERKVNLEIGGGADGGLTWANEPRVLKTQPRTGVKIHKDDGSVIEAGGMTLDLGSNQMALEGAVRGTWTPETNNDANTLVPPPTALSSPSR